MLMCLSVEFGPGVIFSLSPGGGFQFLQGLDAEFAQYDTRCGTPFPNEWNATRNGTWGSGSNWDEGRVPCESEPAVFPAGNYTVDVSSNVTTST